MSTGNLIALVEMHPSIWDKSCEKYKDKYEKDKAWIEVARRIVPDWDTFGKKEQNKKMDALKKKWKNIKDSLKKYLDAKSDIAKKKKYIHLEALSFLLSVAEKRSTTGNFDCDSSEEEHPDESNTATSSTLPLSDFTLPTSSIHPENTSTPKQHSFKKPSRSAKISRFRKSLIKNLSRASSSLTQAKAAEDADRLYLLSILPDYKALSPGRKWAFRQHVGDFFQQTYVSPTSTPSLSFQNYQTLSRNFLHNYQEHSSLPFPHNVTQLQQSPQSSQTPFCNIPQQSSFSPSLSSQSQ